MTRRLQQRTPRKNRTSQPPVAYRIEAPPGVTQYGGFLQVMVITMCELGANVRDYRVEGSPARMVVTFDLAPRYAEETVQDIEAWLSRVST